MRKANKLLAGLISLSLAMSVCAMPALAAEGEASATEATTYVVTFRPGEHGRFTENYVNGLITAYGADNVKQSTATGAVAVQLEEGEPLPNAPQLTDIAINADASRYFVTDAAQGYTGGTAAGDMSAVAQYTLRASEEKVIFTVHYLDRETGAEVAPTLQGSAPVGQNLTFYALNNIANYTAELASQQLTISANAEENVVIFHYTAGVNNVTETVTVPGGTVTQYEDRTVVGGAAVAGGGVGGAAGAVEADGTGGAADAAAGETVTIPEEDTPQAGGDNTPGGEDVAIPDESTPQANLPGESTNGSVMPMVFGGAAAVLVIGAIVWAINRRRNVDGE